MITQMTKLSASVPRDLVDTADEIAGEMNISRSKLISSCLKELAEKRKAELLARGYRAMAKEHKEFAEISVKAALEVLPPWE